MADEMRPRWIVSRFKSVGPLKFGMTLGQCAMALDAATCSMTFYEDEDREFDRHLTRADFSVPAGCSNGDGDSPPRAPGQVSVWHRYGHLVQVDIAADAGPRVFWQDIELTGQPLGPTIQMVERATNWAPPPKDETPQQQRERQERRRARLAKDRQYLVDHLGMATWQLGAEMGRISPRGIAFNHWWGFALVPARTLTSIDEWEAIPCSVRVVEYRQSMFMDACAIHSFWDATTADL